MKAIRTATDRAKQQLIETVYQDDSDTFEQDYRSFYLERARLAREVDCMSIDHFGFERWYNARRSAARENSRLQREIEINPGTSWAGLTVEEAKIRAEHDSDRRTQGRSLAVDSMALQLETFSQRYQLTHDEKETLIASLAG